MLADVLAQMGQARHRTRSAGTRGEDTSPNSIGSPEKHQDPKKVPPRISEAPPNNVSKYLSKHHGLKRHTHTHTHTPLNPKPSTLNPQPSTLNPNPLTLNPDGPVRPERQAEASVLEAQVAPKMMVDMKRNIVI